MKSLNPKNAYWHGKRVWIVGASSGIGAALARQLEKAGARLANSARRESALREIGVYLVNPGFVATRLTQDNDFNMPALITPEEAVQEIVAGLGKGLFEIRFLKRFTGRMKLSGRMPDRIRLYLLGKAVQS